MISVSPVLLPLTCDKQVAPHEAYFNVFELHVFSSNITAYFTLQFPEISQSSENVILSAFSKMYTIQRILDQLQSWILPVLFSAIIQAQNIPCLKKICCTCTKLCALHPY